MNRHVFVAVGIGLLVVASDAGARLTLGNTCVLMKNHAASRAFECLVDVQRRILLGSAADVEPCRRRFSVACSNAERRGGCPTSCDALQNRISATVDAVFAALQPSPPADASAKACVGAEGRAVARYVACVATVAGRTLGGRDFLRANVSDGAGGVVDQCGLVLLRILQALDARGCPTTADARAVRALANPAGMNLAGADLGQRRLVDSYLAGADFSGAHFRQTQLDGADLDGADLRNVAWDETGCPDGSRSDTNGSSPQSCCGHLGGAVPASCGADSTVRQIEAFDAVEGWAHSGNGSSMLSLDTQDQREGTGALAWRSTIDEEITKAFAVPQDLGSAAELRIWLRANRTAGSACCGFTMRLLSGSGYFEYHVLPDLPPDTWVDVVSERDAWAASPYGAPSWSSIDGFTAIFYGDYTTTSIAFDDLRMATVSSTAPTVRRSAGMAQNGADGPFQDAFDWTNPGNATVADGLFASVSVSEAASGFVSSRYLEATGFGFTIPANAVIRGIRVEVAQQRSAGFLLWDQTVSLMRNGQHIGVDHGYSDDLTTTTAYRYYGGPTELWGASWTPADINAPDFGVAFALATHSPPATGLVDEIRIGVYYE